MMPVFEFNQILVENLNTKIKSEDNFTLDRALEILFKFKSKIPIDQELLKTHEKKSM
jgi:hypothetical protein